MLKLFNARVLIIITVLYCFVPFSYGQQDSPKEEDLYFAANKAYENGYYDAGLSLSERFARDYPYSSRRAEVELLSGQCYLKQGKIKEAIRVFEGMLKNNSAQSLKDSVYYWAGEAYSKANEIGKAANSYRLLLQEFPGSAYADLSVYCLGHILFEQGNFREALDAFKEFEKKARRQDTDLSPYLFFYIAEAEYYLGDFNSAAGYYSKALRSPGAEKLKPFLHLGLGWSYLKTEKNKDAFLEFSKVDDLLLKDKERNILFAGKAEVAYNNNEYGRAVDFYSQALRQEEYLPPGLADKLRYNLSLALTKEGRVKEAVAELEKIISGGRDQVVKQQALLQIGSIYQGIGEYKKAIEALGSLLKLYPQGPYAPSARYQLGISYLDKGDYRCAISALLPIKEGLFDQGIKDDALYALGFAYFKNEEFDKAAGIINPLAAKAISEGLGVKSNYLLGEIYYNLGDFNQAIFFFGQALNRSQDVLVSQKAEYWIADSLYHIGKEKEALAKFNALRSRYPGYPVAAEAAFWLGGYYYQNNQPRLARRYFLHIIQDHPDSPLLPEAYYSLALCFMDDSNLQDALDNFNKAFSSGGQELKAKSAMASGDIFLKQGVLDEAEAFYGKALTCSPKDDSFILCFKIAETGEAQGRLELALKYYLKAAETVGRDNRFAVNALLRAARIYEDLDRLGEAEGMYKQVARMGIKESAYAKERLLSIRKAANKK